jgi:glycosyltransferase involved in cell wall biosynthesis
MRLGIIAQSSDRGLGIQTWEACRHLEPERVLLVEPQGARWRRHRDRFADFETTIVKWDGRTLDEQTCRRWLDGLDVVYTAETPYDERLPRWAFDVRCAVAVHANPEQLHPRSTQTPHVSWWAPTDWRIHQMPFGTKVVPMPVATERFGNAPAQQCDSGIAGPVTFVHSAGHEAQHDRNGTRLVAQAVRGLENIPGRLVVFGQDGALPRFRLRSGVANFELDLHPAGAENYWDQYRGGDVLLMPRRYGGLCLPVQEALAAGLAVVMTDCSPNEKWPGPRLPVVDSTPMRTRCGEVAVNSADPDDLRVLMEKLATDRDWLAELKAEALRWAAANSWEALLPRWRKEFERVCRR